MTFNDEELREFVEIWGDECGERLTLEEARSKATQLVEFFATLRRAERELQARERTETNKP